MVTKVPLAWARGKLGELAQRAMAGERIVLTQHGHERVVLVPVDQYDRMVKESSELRARRALQPAELRERGVV